MSVVTLVIISRKLSKIDPVTVVDYIEIGSTESVAVTFRSSADAHLRRHSGFK